jgi:hypothetical protein
VKLVQAGAGVAIVTRRARRFSRVDAHPSRVASVLRAANRVVAERRIAAAHAQDQFRRGVALARDEIGDVALIADTSFQQPSSLWLDAKLDSSASGITARLREAAQLLELCRQLERTRTDRSRAHPTRGWTVRATFSSKVACRSLHAALARAGPQGRPSPDVGRDARSEHSLRLAAVESHSVRRVRSGDVPCLEDGSAAGCDVGCVDRVWRRR